MEVFYQVSLQIILLLFTQTKTPTTGGWESFFEQDSYLGLPLHPETILALSATWSLKTCIFLHIKTISVEKGFFPVTSRMAVFCWALFATLRKVLSNLAFFTPSLGLFSLLHHWQAEQIYFKSPDLLAKKFNKAPVQIPQFDKINLYNMSETVLWSSLDRWSYEDPLHPTPPPYSLYTGMSLQNTFFAFIAIFLLQIMVLLLVKILISNEFAEKKYYFSKLAHLMQNTNLPFPFKDWDNGNFDSIEDFKQRYKNTLREMGWTYFVTFLFTLFMLFPLYVTGKVINYKDQRSTQHFISVYNINTRHEFLSRFIGTKKEEDDSMEAAIKLVIAFTTCLIGFSVLEISFYFIYNRFVRPGLYKNHLKRFKI